MPASRCWASGVGSGGASDKANPSRPQPSMAVSATRRTASLTG
jgi:hypothetical protein